MNSATRVMIDSLDLESYEPDDKRLIAAAPALLEALERVMDALAYGGVDEQFEEQYREGEAALLEAQQ
jgi:hypothetical protein